MSKDYAYKKGKRTSRQAQAQSSLVKLLVITLILIGGFIAALMYLQQRGHLYVDEKAQKQKNSPTNLTSQMNKDKNRVEKKASLPRFEFYTLLPKMDVPVSAKVNEKVQPSVSQTSTIIEANATADERANDDGLAEELKQSGETNKNSENRASSQDQSMTLKEVENQERQDTASFMEKMDSEEPDIVKSEIVDKRKNNSAIKKLPEAEAPVTAAKPIPTLPIPADETAGKTKKLEAEKGPKTSGKYIVQVGLFRSRDDADSLKAELLMMGLDVSLHKLNRNGVDWFQVRLGPYHSFSAAEASKKQLLENNFHGVVKSVG